MFDINDHSYNRFAHMDGFVSQAAAENEKTQGLKNVQRGHEEEGTLRVDELKTKFFVPATDPTIPTGRTYDIGGRDPHYKSLMDKIYGGGNVTKNRSILFDMYAIMALLQEVAQKMRNAMRELRKLENATIYANIKAQARIQREAAICAALAGGVLTLLQAGIMFSSMKKQLSGMQQQAMADKLSGQAMAQKQANMASVSDSTKAAEQLKTVESRLSTYTKELDAHPTDANPSVTKNFDAKCNDIQKARSELTTAQNNLKKAQEPVTTAETKFTTAKEQLSSLDTEIPKANSNCEECRTAYGSALKSANNELTKAKADLATAQKSGKMSEFMGASERLKAAQSKVDNFASGPEAKNLQAAEGKLKSLNKQKATLQRDLPGYEKAFNDAKNNPQNKTAIDKAQTKLNEAQKNYNRVVGSDEDNVGFDEKAEGFSKHEAGLQDVEAAKKDYEDVRQKLLDLKTQKTEGKTVNAKGELVGVDKKPLKAEISHLEKELVVKGERYELARARQVSHSADLKLDPSVYRQTHQAVKLDARKAADGAATTAISAAGHMKGTKAMLFQQLAMTIGQYAQQLVNSFKDIMMSKSTELQADQKLTEDQLDQIKDLFAQYLQVVQKAIELFQNVVQKESQTIEEILRA